MFVDRGPPRTGKRFCPNTPIIEKNRPECYRLPAHRRAGSEEVTDAALGGWEVNPVDLDEPATRHAAASEMVIERLAVSGGGAINVMWYPVRFW
jgi:transcription termination factor Rho